MQTATKPAIRPNAIRRYGAVGSPNFRDRPEGLEMVLSVALFDSGFTLI